MRRFSDWPTRLDAFLRAEQFHPFQYGEWDCCLFVCDAVRVMTGVDLAAEYRGAYRTRKEAMRAIAARTGRVGVMAVAEAAAEAHSMPEIPPSLAGRGDMVMLPAPSLAIVALNGRDAIVTSPNGLWRVPLRVCGRAWRV